MEIYEINGQWMVTVPLFLFVVGLILSAVLVWAISIGLNKDMMKLERAKGQQEGIIMARKAYEEGLRRGSREGAEQFIKAIKGDIHAKRKKNGND